MSSTETWGGRVFRSEGAEALIVVSLDVDLAIGRRSELLEDGAERPGLDHLAMVPRAAAAGDAAVEAAPRRMIVANPESGFARGFGDPDRKEDIGPRSDLVREARPKIRHGRRAGLDSDHP